MEPAPRAGPSLKWQDLGVRAVSAAVLIPAVLADIWSGGVWFHLFAALLAVLMAHEWTVIVHRQSSSQFAFHAAAGLCGAFLHLEAGTGVALAAIGVLWALSLAGAWASGRPVSHWAVWGVPYVSLPAFALVLLRDDAAHGLAVIVWLFVAVWCADTFAYFFGRIIGGPKLWPAVSPKKTWAGLLGAVVGGAAAGIGLDLAIGHGNVILLALIGAGLGVVEQGGDLFESAMKRAHGVKDSGALIPGHGGVLDRVDGLVAAAMAAALIGVLHRGPQAAAAGLINW